MADNTDHDLRDIDERILDLLREGRCTRRYLAEQLGVTGEYVYQRVDLLRRLGLIEVIHDGFYRLADDAESRERTESQSEPARAPETHVGSEPDPEPADEIDRVVEAAAASWDDRNGRLDARKDAARAALRELRDRGLMTKEEMLELEELHPVEGQSPDTWYRANIHEKGPLKRVAQYDSGERAWRWVGEEEI
jgi:DNA-binding Lrp family transcriptional regulator